MNLPGRICLFALVCLLALSNKGAAQESSDKRPSADADTAAAAEPAALEKKASEAQARIRANGDETGQLKRAIKLNQVAVAKEILLRNGFNAKDLEDANISLRTGGGKGGEDTIEISATCCAPKEITIRRTLENFTKTKP